MATYSEVVRGWGVADLDARMAALAGLVLQRDEATNNRIVMHMGAEIGRPSVLYAGAQRGDDGVRVWLAGQCVEMMREFIEAEPTLWNEDIMEL